MANKILSKTNERDSKLPQESNWAAINIFLFSNGQEYSPPRKYHLTPEELNWWDATLNYLARSHYGSLETCIELYTIDGCKIKGPLELTDGMYYVAVVPPDEFIDSGYENYLMKASRSWEKRQAKRTTENKPDEPKTDCSKCQICCPCPRKCTGFENSKPQEINEKYDKHNSVLSNEGYRDVALSAHENVNVLQKRPPTLSDEDQSVYTCTTAELTAIKTSDENIGIESFISQALTRPQRSSTPTLESCEDQQTPKSATTSAPQRPSIIRTVRKRSSGQHPSFAKTASQHNTLENSEKISPTRNNKEGTKKRKEEIKTSLTKIPVNEYSLNVKPKRPVTYPPKISTIPSPLSPAPLRAHPDNSKKTPLPSLLTSVQTAHPDNPKRTVWSPSPIPVRAIPHDPKKTPSPQRPTPERAQPHDRKRTPSPSTATPERARPYDRKRTPSPVTPTSESARPHDRKRIPLPASPTHERARPRDRKRIPLPPSPTPERARPNDGKRTPLPPSPTPERARSHNRKRTPSPPSPTPERGQSHDPKRTSSPPSPTPERAHPNDSERTPSPPSPTPERARTHDHERTPSPPSPTPERAQPHDPNRTPSPPSPAPERAHPYDPNRTPSPLSPVTESAHPHDHKRTPSQSSSTPERTHPHNPKRTPSTISPTPERVYPDDTEQPSSVSSTLLRQQSSTGLRKTAIPNNIGYVGNADKEIIVVTAGTKVFKSTSDIGFTELRRKEAIPVTGIDEVVSCYIVDKGIDKTSQTETEATNEINNPDKNQEFNNNSKTKITTTPTVVTSRTNGINPKIPLGDNYIAVINKGDAVDMNLNIQLQNGNTNTKINDDASKQYEVRKVSSMSNILKKWKSQSPREDSAPGETKSLQSFLSAINDCYTKVVIVQCGCCGTHTAIPRIDTLPVYKDNNGFYILMPGPTPTVTNSCACGPNQDRSMTFEKKILSELCTEDLANPKSDTVYPCVAQDVGVVMTVMHCGLRSRESQKNESDSYMMTKQVCINEEQSEGGDCGGTPSQQTQKIDLIECRSSSRSRIPSSTADVFTQTEWCCLLVQVKHHKDDRYSFHLPPLELVKYYSR